MPAERARFPTFPAPLIFAVVAMACASGREKGTVVSVVRNREAVRPCAFLGRLNATGAGEGEALPEGSLRRQTAERGGNVLLLLPAGTGEAYFCKEKLLVFDDRPPGRPTPIGLLPAPTPTPQVWRSAVKR